MIKKRFKTYSLYFILCLSILIFALFFVKYNKNSKNLYADSVKYPLNISLNNDFSDSSLLVTLDNEHSQYNEISEYIKIELSKIPQIESIESITDLNNDYLNSCKSINSAIAPNLTNFYSNNDFNQILLIRLSTKDKNSVLSLMRSISTINGIKYVEPNMQTTITTIPNDPYYSKQWALNESNGINAVDAWKFSDEISTVNVGIIDTGIINHPDLINILNVGWDFHNNDSNTSDDVIGHGTNVAGIIGAMGNNDIGGIGIAQNITLTPLQIGDHKKNYFDEAETINAIFYAINSWETSNRISILNYSFSNFGKSRSILNAIRLYPGLFIWSAGNIGQNTDNYTDIDLYRLNNLISVGAVDKNNERSVWGDSSSCYGTHVSIFAPGGKNFQAADNVFTTDNDNQYTYFNGTSAAAPHVAGSAALLLSNSPKLSSNQLKNIITSSASDITISIPSGTQKVKKLNLYEALMEIVNPFETTEISAETAEISKVLYHKDKLDIPNTYKGKLLTSIGYEAFINTQFHTVTIADSITKIDNFAFLGCSSLENINIHENIETIGFGAFKGCYNLNFSVAEQNEVFSLKYNMLTNKSHSEILHTGHIPQSLTIPDTVEKVAPYAFAGNVNLEAIRFNGNTLLGDNAFADCDNLKYVYFDTFTPPSFGDSVFANNYPTVYVPYNAQADYKAALPSLANFIQSVQFTVHFISDGQAIASLSVYNGSTIENLPSVDIKGYEFGGWYDNSSYTGEQFANGQIWQSESDINLYAKLTPIQYTVTLDAAGGVLIGNDNFQVTFDGTFNTAASATRTGHGLEGWYDENDVKYLTADGACTRTWDKASNATLFAKWYVESYEIQIADDRNVVWLSNNGLSDNLCYIQYGTVINTINLIKVFKNSAQGFREGKIFDCFSYNNAQLDWTTVPDLGDDKSIVTIYPIWVNEVHTIYFNALCQIDVPKVEAEYDATIDLPNTARTGYILNGWYTAQSGGQKFNWVRMPDLTPDAQNNGSVMLYARWSPITYTVKYDLNGYSGALASTSHTYDVNLALRYYSPNRTGYNFKGWSTTRNGEVNFSNAENVANLTSVNGATVTLYAVWSPISYFFNFKNLIDGMFGSITYYTYGEGLAVMPTLRMRPASFAPSYEYPNFYGWYTTSAFTTQITSVSKTQTGAITLYAKYDYMLATESHENTYTVTDDGGTKNPNFQIAVNLKSYHYNIVKNTTLKTIRFEISFDMWKVDDGYQHIYLRNDDVDTTGKSPMEIISESLVLSQKLDISSGTHHKSYTVTLDLEKFKNSNSFTLLFDASGAFSDTWKFNNLNIKAYLTN